MTENRWYLKLFILMENNKNCCMIEDILIDYDAYLIYNGSKILIEANNLWVN